MAATSQNEVGCTVLSDRSQPQQTGLLHSVLTITQFTIKFGQ